METFGTCRMGNSNFHHLSSEKPAVSVTVTEKQNFPSQRNPFHLLEYCKSLAGNCKVNSINKIMGNQSYNFEDFLIVIFTGYTRNRDLKGQ